MRKQDYYELYSRLINLLDDDDTYILFFNIVPFSILRLYVPMSYLAARHDDLKKKGLL